MVEFFCLYFPVASERSLKTKLLARRAVVVVWKTIGVKRVALG